ncbi:hypothetical protein Haur_2777 [Herpetosiphon aurantiacus DSM 785]|uniref:DUF5667 domain-containing protein n=2 Tax=Herpetosiphon TaxID=64 RepID=A9B1X3_HERA2|nr:hypothetical protein Haur_2777 [Herpetosiphon aurantiacus DSM 785]
MNDNLSHMIIDAWQNGASLETLCQQYPHHAEAIQQLINPLIQLQRVNPPTMPARASHAQADFMRLAQHYRAQTAPKPKPRRRLLTQRWVWATATILLLVCLSGNLVLSASASALPGDSLYGIKRWSESISLVFTPSAEQLTARIDLVNERQHEIASLVALNKPVPSELLDEVVNETQSIELALAPTHTNDPRRSKLSQVNQQLQTTIAIIPVENATDNLKHHDLIETLDQSRQRIDIANLTTIPTQPAKVLVGPTATKQPSIAPAATDLPHIANPKLPPKPHTPTQEPTEVVLPTSTSTPWPTAKPTRVPPPVIKPTATATSLPTSAPTDVPMPTSAPTDVPMPTSAPTDVPVPTEIPSIGLPTATPTIVREQPTAPVPTKDPGDIKPTEVPPTSPPTSPPPTKEPPPPSPTKEPEDTKGQPNPILQY